MEENSPQGMLGVAEEGQHLSFEFGVADFPSEGFVGVWSAGCT